MGVGAKITAEEALKRLRGMEDRGGNLSGLMRFYGEYQKGSIDRNFAAGGSPGAWAPLKLGTLSGWAVSRKSHVSKKTGLLTKRGREALAGRKPLIASGVLRRASFYIAGARSMTLVNADPKAAIHQFGAKIPPIFPRSKQALAWPGLAHPVKRTRGGIIPARPFMVFQDEDIVYFDRLYLDYLLTGRIG